MNKKGIEFTSRTLAVLILGLMFFTLALVFTTRGNKLMAYFERKIAGRSPEATYSNFIRECNLACELMDGSFNSSKPQSYDFCTITMDTRDIEEGGIKEDHCYGESGGLVNVECKVENIKGNKIEVDEDACEGT